MVIKVALSDIEQIDFRRDNLKQSRIDTLLDGYSSFEEVINSKSDPITLSGANKPYEIIDGRHRVYLARQKGYTHVPARCLWLE